MISWSSSPSTDDPANVIGVGLIITPETAWTLGVEPIYEGTVPVAGSQRSLRDELRNREVTRHGHNLMTVTAVADNEFIQALRFPYLSIAPLFNFGAIVFVTAMAIIPALVDAAQTMVISGWFHPDLGRNSATIVIHLFGTRR